MSADSSEAAQVTLDRFWATKRDARLRSPRGVEEPTAEGGRPRWPTIGELAEAEALLALPVAPYPATIEVTATVDHQGDRVRAATHRGFATPRSSCTLVR